MTRSVYKKLPSKNQKLNKNQKEKFVEPTKQQTSTSKTNTKAKTKCVTKKNQKGKFQKKINKQTEKQPQNKDLFRKLLQTKVDFKNIQKEMLHRKIQQNDNILKNKPYFNYFHCKNYEKDSRKCDNCFDSLTSDENEMLHCESCNSYIHKLCYSVSQDQFDIINLQETEDEYNFSFIKCESCLEREINPEIDLQCIICQRDIGIMKCFFFDSRKVQYSSKKNQQYSDYEYCVDKTPVILLNEEQVKKNKFIKRVFVHPLCVNSSSCLFIYQFKLLLIWDEEDYKKKSNQGKKNKCQQCLKGNGLLIQCEHQDKQFPSCKQFYHPLCAAEKKMIYYQQGMRLIHSNEEVKYSDIEQNITYYYIICNNHIAQIFNQKQSKGFFNHKQQIFSQLKISTEEEQKNYDDWMKQMIEEYDPQGKNNLDQEDDSYHKFKAIKDSINEDIRYQQNEPVIFGIENLDQFYFLKNGNQTKRQNDSKNVSKNKSIEEQEVSQQSDSYAQIINQKQSTKCHNLNANQPISKQESQPLKIEQELLNKQKICSNEKREENIQNLLKNQEDSTDNIYKSNIKEQQKLIDKKDVNVIQNMIEQNQQAINRYFQNSKHFNLDKIFSDKFLCQKKEFELKINKKKSLSSEKYGSEQISLQIQKEKEKSLKLSNLQNKLKRELGLVYPSPPQKKSKRLQQKQSVITEDLGDEELEEGEEEKDLQNEKNKGEPEIEIRIADKQTTKNKQSKKALLETDGENYQTDKSFLDKEESSYYNGEKSEQEEQVNQLRRSSRVKKAPVPLDNNIFRVYQQKKSSLKEKDTNSNTSYESKQTSSESKQIEEKNPFFSSSCSKQEKQQKSKVSNKNQKKQKKQKGQGLYSLNEDENDFYSNQQDELDLSDFFHSKSKPSKKLKSENNQFQGQCQRQLKFDNLDSSIEEQKEISNNSQQNQIKINHRNLDERGDNLIYGDDTFYGNDSFQLMLDSEPTELEEVSDLGYLIENINKYDNEKNKQEGDDDDIEDDVPIDLPDLTSHLIYESGERDNQGQTIFQLENNISCLEQKIFFLKEDSKLKKYSILNDQNFEQYQEKELNRLVSRKEMLESQIKDKRKNKIEKYRQQLHYFDQTIDLKCLPNFLNENLHKSLDRNNNQQIPSYRLIKYKNNQYQDFSKEIPLHFQLSDCNQKFDIIGFSVLTKLNVKPNKHQNQIHNFFSFEK